MDVEMREAAAPRTSSGEESTVIVVPDCRVASRRSGISRSVGWGTSGASPDPRRIVSSPRIFVECPSGRVRDRGELLCGVVVDVGMRYSAVVACTLMTDMLWATTSCSSWAILFRSASSRLCALCCALASSARRRLSRLRVSWRMLMPSATSPAQIGAAMRTLSIAPGNPSDRRRSTARTDATAPEIHPATAYGHGCRRARTRTSRPMVMRVVTGQGQGRPSTVPVAQAMAKTAAAPPAIPAMGQRTARTRAALWRSVMTIARTTGTP